MLLLLVAVLVHLGSKFTDEPKARPSREEALVTSVRGSDISPLFSVVRSGNPSSSVDTFLKLFSIFVLSMFVIIISFPSFHPSSFKCMCESMCIQGK